LGGSQFEASPAKKKINSTSPQSVSQVWWLMPVIPATMGGINRRIEVQTGPDKNSRLYLKNN
jgi:hypothetical protein